jgi:hypothetical protein
LVFNKKATVTLKVTVACINRILAFYSIPPLTQSNRTVIGASFNEDAVMPIFPSTKPKLVTSTLRMKASFAHKGR